ncbi:hypothetical protein ACM7LV_26875 [Pseudomonas aeruginosa]|nr:MULTISPECIES: hypothetical protein [Pseudomonas]KFF32397.1 hypothetical protein G039_0332860 [Pseudomonas aeruginosa VRFPA01]EKV3606917.1 hypothetical protein [Pseudomonas aeruginosa]EKW6796102.1 hypothetical protein [Pseudomonas aeruginosa]EKX7258163.1 hypothetical protein [Pseudomonas aeruginosa]ELI0480945.1 hypothetical protein [Pseudomonas aeruginosa]
MAGEDDKSRVEPGLGGDDLGDLDRMGQPEDLDQGQPKKRSMSAVLREVKNNRVALGMILAVVVVGSAVGYRKFQERKMMDGLQAGPTRVVIPDSAISATRNQEDNTVKTLDQLTEQAGAKMAQQTGGTYIAPITEPTEPLPPPAAPPKPPTAPEAPKSNAAAERAAERQQKADEKMLKAAQDQLAKLDRQVYGDQKGRAMFVSNDVTEETLAATSSKQKADGVLLGYPMGTVWLGKLTGGADTDRPGTIKVDIEEGPFAGKQAICNFTWPSREYINIECSNVMLEKESFPIKMVVVAPDQMPGVPAEYDGRYLARLGTRFLTALPAALAEGISRGGTTTYGSNSTTTTEKELNGTDLAIYAAGKASEPIIEEGQKIADEIKPRAHAPAGQMVGLMLAEDI